jgi:excisionase family DNA binding protein
MTLTPTEAARLLHMTPDALMRKARAGKIPGAKVGRSWLFIEADLIAMIRKDENGATARTA